MRHCLSACGKHLVLQHPLFRIPSSSWQLLDRQHTAGKRLCSCMRCSAGFNRPRTRASLQPHCRHALNRLGPAFSAAITTHCAGWCSPGLCSPGLWRVQPQLQKSAALPPGGANKHKRGRPPLAKRACPAGNAGRASAHRPGTYVYDEVQAACDSGLYTCGTVLMPAGHALDPATTAM
jgi:hypothetical protein